MKKKVISVMLGALMAVSMLAGCGSTGGGGANASSADKKLTIWTNMEVEADAIQEIADDWGKTSGYTVNVIHQSPSVQQFAQAAKSADAPDAVIGIPNDQLADYVNAGLAQEVPAGTFEDSDYSNSAIMSCYSGGKEYAAPLAVETVTLFYNKDLISEVPATWEDLIETAKDKGGVQFDATSIYYDFGFVRASDGYIFKYNDGAYDVNDIGLDNDGAIEAYEFINSLYKDYGFVSADVTADIARSNFQNGQCAFYIGGPWDIDGFKSAGLNFDVAKMPTFKGKPFVTPVGTQVSFVSSKSANQEAAWDLIKYVSSDGAQKLYEVGSRIPAKLSEQESDAIKNDAATATFIAQINDGEPMPTVSEMGQLWDIYTNNIRSMWSGELTPEATGKNIVDQLKEAISLMDSGK